MEETENSHFCVIQDQGRRWCQLLRSHSTTKTARGGWCPTPSPQPCPAIPWLYLDSSSLTRPDVDLHLQPNIPAWPWRVPWRCLMPQDWHCPKFPGEALPCWGDPRDPHPRETSASLGLGSKFQIKNKKKKKKYLIKHFPVSNFPLRSTRMIWLIFRYPQSTRNLTANSCIKFLQPSTQK